MDEIPKQKNVSKDSISRWIINWLKVHIDKSIVELDFNRSIHDYIPDSIMQIKFINDVQQFFLIDAPHIENQLYTSLYTLHDFIKNNKHAIPKQHLIKAVFKRFLDILLPFITGFSKKIARLIGKAAMQFYTRINVMGYANIEVNKHYIFIANHSSHLDSFALFYGLTQHKLVFLAASDYFFSNPIKKFYYNAFLPLMPMTRQGINIKDFKNTLRELEKHSVVIYPEGTRSLTGVMQPFKGGAALLSLQTGIPVVPIYIHGAHRLWPKGQRFPKPGNMYINIGKPIIPLPHKRISNDLLAQLTAQYEAAVKALAQH